jgi:hypothetical protein
MHRPHRLNVSHWHDAVYCIAMKIVPAFTLELRHNDEVLGRLTARGVVESVQDEVLHGEVRFWIGLGCLRRPRRHTVRRFRLVATHA